MLRTRRRLLLVVLVAWLGLVGGLVAPGPAAVAQVDPVEPRGEPSCTVERFGTTRGLGSCVNGSSLYRFRIWYYCQGIGPGLFESLVVSPWAPTTQNVIVECNGLVWQPGWTEIDRSRVA